MIDLKCLMSSIVRNLDYDWHVRHPNLREILPLQGERVVAATVRLWATFSGPRKRLIERQCALGQPLGERLPFQVLHHQEVDPTLAAHIVHGADVRMAQGRQRFRLALEPLLQFRVSRNVLVQDFDSTRAVEPGTWGQGHR
jgi:hypothetical protein